MPSLREGVCDKEHAPSLATVRNGGATMGMVMDFLQGSERECAMASLRDETPRM